MCSFNYYSSSVFLLIIMEEVCDDNLLNFFMWQIYAVSITIRIVVS